jgi:hypothetical protein
MRGTTDGRTVFNGKSYGDPSYDKLKKLKVGKESFPEMLMRELPDRVSPITSKPGTRGRIKTGHSEVLEKLAGKEPPPMDPNLLKAVRNGRGRRFHRNFRHAR